MGTWGIALLSALAGGAITGGFTLLAAARQAEAARYSGNRQADALLATVRMQLEEQRAERLFDSRRKTYLGFTAAVDDVIRTRRGSGGPKDSGAVLRRAFGAVQLEGPAETVRAAQFLLECLREGADRSPDDQEHARQEFLDVARNALVSVTGEHPSENGAGAMIRSE